MISNYKELEYIATLNPDLFCVEYLPRIVRYRLAKNSRRKNREKTVRKTVLNIGKHERKK